MRRFKETEISKAIIDAYHEKLTSRIVNDVLIVGAGPAGMVAGYYLSKAGFKVALIERNLAWLPRIVELTEKTDDYLVIVGALHLVGQHGVVELECALDLGNHIERTLNVHQSVMCFVDFVDRVRQLATAPIF